jgi:hypothetical protein
VTLYAAIHRVDYGAQNRPPVYHLVHPHFPNVARCSFAVSLDLNTAHEEVPPASTHCQNCRSRQPITKDNLLADVLRRFPWAFPPESDKEDSRREQAGKEPREWAPTRRMAIEQAKSAKRA